MMKLTPFHTLDDFTVNADVRIEEAEAGRSLVINHRVTPNSGGRVKYDLDKILWPEKSRAPKRRDELWKHTCFEAFIKPTGQERYWEINVSPAGHWNVYRFDAYRSGMAVENSVTYLKNQISTTPQEFSLETVLWLPDWNLIEDFEIGLTAVIEEKSGAISYWALSHLSSQPDFHRAGSFTLKKKKSRPHF